MNTSKRFDILWLGMFAFAVSVSPIQVQGHDVKEEMADAANQFLRSLSEDQRSQATFDLDDEERFNWHYFPRQRKGVSLKEMSPAQRQHAYAFLNSGLSYRGYVKALTIMSLEQILYDLEGGRDIRDPQLYYVSVFGEPSADGTWGWRVEGHHLSVNFTLVDGKAVATTPSFYGANPAEVKEGPQKGLRPLAREEDLARRLVQSLNREQREQAIFSEESPEEILTGADREAQALEPLGLARQDLTQKQQELLTELIREYVDRYRPQIADAAMQEIEDGGEIHFAWGGRVEKGAPHYYRIQGATFLMEYANTQNDANHIHAVWRDLQNDFGEDLLQRHYSQHPHN